MGIHGYHQGNASWRENGERKGSATLEGNFVGVEIETYNEAGNEATSRIVDEVGLYKKQETICEADGSIDYAKGIEVITPPIELATAIRKDGYLAKLVEALKEGGVKVDPANNYGLHINVNVNTWSVSQKSLLQLGVYLLKDVCQKLGKRNAETHFQARPDMYWVPGVVIDLARHTFTMGNGRADFQRPEKDKYQPAWVRPNGKVVEIRYPKAVLDFDNIKRNISLAYALRAFFGTEEGRFCGFLSALAVNKGKPIDAIRKFFVGVFMAWLSKQKNFKNLYTAIVVPNKGDVYSFEEIKDYAKDALKFGNAVVQEQALEWCAVAARKDTNS